MSIMIDSDFPGGAVEDVNFISENQVEFRVPLRGSPRGMWFYFRVKGACGREMEFRIKNVDQMLSWQRLGSMLPVKRNGPDGEWHRLPEEALLFSSEEKSLSFRVSMQHEEVYIAYCYPYQYENLQAFIQKYRGNPLLHIEYPRYSGEGRKFPMIVIGSPQSARKFFVCTARAHAGEVSGSYVLEGVMEKLLENTRTGEKIRNELFAVIFPMLDLNGVEEGRYGKDRPPVDFNRDWTLDSIHPEIRLVQEKIEAFAKQYAYCFYADFHAPGPEPVTYMVPSAQITPDMGKQKALWAQIWRFGKMLEERAPEEFPFRVKDYPRGSIGWSGELLMQTGTAYNTLKHDVHSATFELSYHKSINGRVIIPEYWRKFGKAWVECLYDFLTQAKDESELPEIPDNGQYLRCARLMCGQWNMKLSENEEGVVTAQGLEEDNLLWFTFYKEIPAEGGKAKVHLRLKRSSEEELRVRVYCYLFKDEVRLRRYDRKDIYVSGQEDHLTVHCDHVPEGGKIRVGIRIENIKGCIEIGLV